MSKKVITPVGTSLFANYMKKHNDITSDYKTIEEEPVVAWDDWDVEIDAIRGVVEPWAREKENASAEITSLLKIQKELDELLEVYFLATETIVSRLAAEILSTIFDTSQDLRWQQISIHFHPDSDDIVKGLQVKNKARFEKEGMVALIRKIENITGWDYENTILNITGGYKATVPYLTIMGQLRNMPLYYTFENAPYDLIKIPQAPIDINWGLFEKYSHVFRQLDEGVGQSWETFKREHNLQEDFRACIYEDQIEPLIGLNAIGELFWNQYQNFFLVRLPLGGEYFGEEANKKRELHKALQELYRRLRTITAPLATLTDPDLKHAVIKDSFIYKHSSPQIRIQYSFDNNRLMVYNYAFITSQAEDKTYSKKMEKQYATLKHGSFATITLRKEL